MNLKARLKKLESAVKIENKDMCIFIVGKSEPPVIGYSHNGVRYMRLENESDDDLKARVESIALQQATRQECGLKVAIVGTINEGY